MSVNAEWDGGEKRIRETTLDLSRNESDFQFFPHSSSRRVMHSPRPLRRQLKLTTAPRRSINPSSRAHEKRVRALHTPYIRVQCLLALPVHGNERA